METLQLRPGQERAEYVREQVQLVALRAQKTRMEAVTMIAGYALKMGQQWPPDERTEEGACLTVVLQVVSDALACYVHAGQIMQAAHLLDNFTDVDFEAAWEAAGEAAGFVEGQRV